MWKDEIETNHWCSKRCLDFKPKLVMFRFKEIKQCCRSEDYDRYNITYQFLDNSIFIILGVWKWYCRFSHIHLYGNGLELDLVYGNVKFILQLRFLYS